MGQDDGGKGCNIREKSTFSTDGGALRESRFDTMKAYGTGQLLSRFMGREYYTNWCYVAGGRLGQQPSYGLDAVLRKLDDEAEYEAGHDRG